MGADNWAVCPFCAEKDPFMGDDYPTWREDYEQGIVTRNGLTKFFVIYAGRCRACGKSHKFKHEEVIHQAATGGPRG